jgi:large subunit ribosomal protein L24
MMSSSIQPRKQRYARANAPMHERKKMMHVHVSKELRAKLGTKRRAVLVKKGDKIRFRKGKNRKKTGTVLEVDYRDLVLYVEGISSKNSKGVQKLSPVQPANVEIVEGDFGQKDRKAMLERSRGAAKAGQKKE